MIRARIDSVLYEVRTKARETIRWRHYYLRIYSGEIMVNADDCRDWQRLVMQADRSVIKYRGMENRGIRLKPWHEVVDEAAI